MAGSETVTASGPVFLHLPYLIFQYTLDLVAQGFRAGLTETNPHDIGVPIFFTSAGGFSAPAVAVISATFWIFFSLLMVSYSFPG